MTQRIFDIENEKDIQDLWKILPDEVTKIQLEKRETNTSSAIFDGGYGHSICGNLININWRDKTEITRPIQEATEADVDKMCVFWDDVYKEKDVGILAEIGGIGKPYRLGNELAEGVEGIELWYDHCRRLTKQEIEELC